MITLLDNELHVIISVLSAFLRYH